MAGRSRSRSQSRSRSRVRSSRSSRGRGGFRGRARGRGGGVGTSIRQLSQRVDNLAKLLDKLAVAPGSTRRSVDGDDRRSRSRVGKALHDSVAPKSSGFAGVAATGQRSPCDLRTVVDVAKAEKAELVVCTTDWYNSNLHAKTFNVGGAHIHLEETGVGMPIEVSYVWFPTWTDAKKAVYKTDKVDGPTIRAHPAAISKIYSNKESKSTGVSVNFPKEWLDKTYAAGSSASNYMPTLAVAVRPLKTDEGIPDGVEYFRFVLELRFLVL